MSRWTAGRYQLLVLSTHYQESSQQLVNYIENIEQKVSQSASVIPESIVEKIRHQSSKSKVCCETLILSIYQPISFAV